MKTAVCLVLAAVVAGSPSAHAQSPKPLAPINAPAAAQVCIACHGAQGEGNASSGFPRIAGQSQYYIAKQLESYANGSRRNALMEPIAKGLSPDIRNALAAFYAQIDAPGAKAAGDPKNERGRALAMTGDAQRRVQACINCHGPGGVGEPPAMPYLAGLDAAYISATLNAWKEGSRTNDAGQQMATVARAMTNEDIAAVAQYYAGLPPPRPAPLHIVQAPPQKKAASGTASIAQQADPRASVGVEQGAPMTGGTQGPSGGGEAKADPLRAPAGPEGVRASKTSPPRATDLQQKAAPPATPRPTTAGGSVNRAIVSEGDPARGRAIIASGIYGCSGCHAIPGIRWPAGVVGPPLGGMAQRGFIAGQLPNKPDVLVAFLQNPPALIPKTGMPNVGLTPDQARDIAAFLYNVRPL